MVQIHNESLSENAILVDSPMGFIDNNNNNNNNNNNININNNINMNILSYSQKVDLWNIQADAVNKISPSKFETSFINENQIFSIHKQVAQLTIPESDKDKEFTVLDIAAGAGFLSIYGANNYINAKFISTDFAENYIKLTNKFIDGNSLSNVKALLMNGQNLHLISNESIEYVFSIFGLIFFNDRIGSLKEIYRVLKPNGKISIVASSKDTFINSSLNKTTQKILGDDYYQFTSVSESLSNPDDLENELKQAGFKNIEIKLVENWIQTSDAIPFTTIVKLNPVYHDHLCSIPVEKRYLFDEILNQEALNSPLRTKSENGTYKFKSFGYVGIGIK